MTLNISEANALNRVVTHLADLRLSGSGEQIVTREQAIDALALLAHGANKALKAGYTQTSAHATLTERWVEPERRYVPTQKGLDYLASRREQHPKAAADA